MIWIYLYPIQYTFCICAFTAWLLSSKGCEDKFLLFLKRLLCVCLCANEHMSTWTRPWERNARRGETLRPACGKLLRWLHRQSSGPLCRSAAGTDAGGGASWTSSSETLSCSCCPSARVDRLSRGPSLDLRLEKKGLPGVGFVVCQERSGG